MIDHATVERIKGTANIVEVVQEFVTLKKSGANYKGLCPFHDEKTPSFVVSPARGTCHCFGCGKGGNPVSFIMEHEQMTYVEALKWLARKYHIEVKERELTNDEKEAESKRESMFIVNEWAAKYFADILQNDPDGQAIGMEYFRTRGFRDDIIKKFQLGFSLSNRRALGAKALSAGYNEEFIIATGLCYKNDRGDLIDRYAGRVIFPWIGLSGKVTGFGGRLLDQRTKGVAQKYVNSPDSDIYHKDRELYGIYQAKKAIAKNDNVFMVEGYTDVIAMHQAGIENVVANSGTALSVHQIRILRRLTTNVTLLYDGDEAGIHAALRGTDMMLAEGMNLKILLLPDGDDPDSFARKHSATDFRQYIEEHQVDFIRFKADLFINKESDPLKRSQGINSIVESISKISNGVLRDTYIHDCAIRTGVNEATLMRELRKKLSPSSNPSPSVKIDAGNAPVASVHNKIPLNAGNGVGEKNEALAAIEHDLAALIIRQGSEVLYDNVETDDGKTVSLTLAQYVNYNLSEDSLHLRNQFYQEILNQAVAQSGNADFNSERYFINHDDIDISAFASSLSFDMSDLVAPSKQQQERIQTEDELKEAHEKHIATLRLTTDHLLADYRMKLLEERKRKLTARFLTVNADQQALMQEISNVQQQMQTLAQMIGRTL